MDRRTTSSDPICRYLSALLVEFLDAFSICPRGMGICPIAAKIPLCPADLLGRSVSGSTGRRSAAASAAATAFPATRRRGFRQRGSNSLGGYIQSAVYDAAALRASNAGPTSGLAGQTQPRLAGRPGSFPGGARGGVFCCQQLSDRFGKTYSPYRHRRGDTNTARDASP